MNRHHSYQSPASQPARRWQLVSKLAGIALCLALATGCPRSAPPPAAPVQPLAGITLTLLVVDDPQMAAAVERLTAEWKAVSGGTLKVEQGTADDVLNMKVPLADAIIYPTQHFGALVEQNLFLPLPKGFLESEPVARSDLFELLVSQETSWARETYALPFGSPVFTVMYRADLLEKLNLQPPRTWSEYQSLVEALAKELQPATLEPLADGWAGQTLLARAAGYARHTDNYSTLFRLGTMQPLIDGPPFVKALEEMVAAHQAAKAGNERHTPESARREVLAGRAAMALAWLSAADPPDNPPQLPEGARLGFAVLPGSEQVFNISSQEWEKRPSGESSAIPLIGFSGRMISVMRTSDYPAGVQQLIAWLPGKQWSAQVASVSPATTLFRNSHLKDAQQWADKNIDSSTALDYAETVQQTLTQLSCLSALRIPGQAEYMAALDEAVIAAVTGQATAKEALTTAAEKWQAISERLGLEKQRRAYQHSFGLTP